MDEDMEQQIDELISNRKKFNDFVYTSVADATNIISARSEDLDLSKILDPNVFVPGVIERGRSCVLARPIATPNFELIRFVSIVDSLGFKPVIWEYIESKFVPQNDVKYYLAKLGFYMGRGKNDGIKIEQLSIIDINSSSGNMMSNLKTFWGESLGDYHHNLFNFAQSKWPVKPIIFDGSSWYEENGPTASIYYEKFLSLFVKDAILFENFLTDQKEISFTKDVFLPAFIRIKQKTGHSPLIVALEPTEIEGDRFWTSYPSELMLDLKDKLSRI
jgi:hypothetical protein